MAKALTIAAPGTQVFGVPGLTTGAVAIVTVLIGNIIIRWVQGIAERRRAENEGVTAVSGAQNLLFENLQKEITRLTLLVSELSREINDLKRELHDERQSKLGLIRNSAQSDLSTIAVIKEGGN